MSLKCGIVGLPNVGKSTLFNALTKAGIAAENYPFCTIEPNVGVVEVPDPRLPFMDIDHYDRLWAAAAECGAPIVCHILTGHSYAKDFSARPRGNERVRNAVNRKEADTANTLFDFIFSGAFDRHPKLKLLLSESEVGWAPFMLQQWDYYWERFRRTDSFAITRPPSEIFAEHVYCTFLEDFVGTRAFSWWGENNCVWSSDYPHFNMSFPHSRENVEKHLHGLPADKRRRLQLRPDASEVGLRRAIAVRHRGVEVIDPRLQRPRHPPHEQRLSPSSPSPPSRRLTQ